MSKSTKKILARPDPTQAVNGGGNIHTQQMGGKDVSAFVPNANRIAQPTRLEAHLINAKLFTDEGTDPVTGDTVLTKADLRLFMNTKMEHVVDLLPLAQGTSTAHPWSNPFVGFWAKTTARGGTDGAYSFDEQQWDGTAWEDKPDGRSGTAQHHGNVQPNLPLGIIIFVTDVDGDGLNYIFESHQELWGDGFRKDMTGNTTETADTDTWAIDDQDSLEYGVEIDLSRNVFLSGSGGTEIYRVDRKMTFDTTGHLIAIGAETSTLVATVDVP